MFQVTLTGLPSRIAERDLSREQSSHRGRFQTGLQPWSSCGTQLSRLWGQRKSLNFPEDQLHGELDSEFYSANCNLLVSFLTITKLLFSFPKIPRRLQKVYLCFPKWFIFEMQPAWRILTPSEIKLRTKWKSELRKGIQAVLMAQSMGTERNRVSSRSAIPLFPSDPLSISAAQRFWLLFGLLHLLGKSQLFLSFKKKILLNFPSDNA